MSSKEKDNEEELQGMSIAGEDPADGKAVKRVAITEGSR